MRILILANSHLPAIGGRELVVHNLALQFQRLGHEVCVAGFGGFWSDRHIRFAYPVQRFPQISRFPLASLRLCTALHGFLYRPDVINVHATYPAGYAAMQVRGVLRAPVVITPHGEDINIVEHIGFGQRLIPEQRDKIEWTVRHADATTAISQTVHASLRDAGAPEERIHDIANGVDTVRFNRPAVAGMAERFGFRPGTPIIASIGNFHPVKGHEVLVEAAARVKAQGLNAGFVIIGRKNEAFCQRVESQGLGDVVKFAGVLPVPDWREGATDPLADLLASARFYVSSSVDEGAEGLSLSLLEGMAAGACPVVSNISGNRDMVQDQINGRVVEPRDPEALASALVTLIRHPEERERLAAAARATASRFGWDVVAAQYLDLYQRLSKGGRTGA